MSTAGKKLQEYPNLATINANTVFVVSNANTTYSVKASVVLALLNTFISNNVPETSSSSGVKGDIRLSETHVYFCVANNSWTRIELDQF